MNWVFKNKNILQQKRKKAILIAFFFVFVFCFFQAFAGKASADETCSYTKKNNEKGSEPSSSEEACLKFCSNMGYTECSFNAANASTATTPALGSESDPNNYNTGTQYVAATTTQKDASCSLGNFECYFKKFLIGILNFVGWLFAIAATLFAWAIEPSNISGANGLLNKQAVKDVWIMVRDTLNMTFILILLFAAFCTIFQVDKWSLKKVWLNILINALLVNFSYPIARFFIDVSNVAFYYFVNNLFTSTGTITGSTIFASFGASSNIGDILQPSQYYDYPVASLLAMIIVVFIMGMTLLVIAGLFIVRLTALVILVMFSPVGFVGYIFPSTEKYANDWWTQLFSYSFFAPIMIFIVSAALHITEALGQENFQSFKSNAAANATSSGLSNFIAQIAFFTIPIVLLWMGIGVAKSFSIAGADAVVKQVKDKSKWLANAPGKYSGVYGGTKKGWENMRKDGSFLGMNNFATRLAFKSGLEDREARMAGLLSGGSKGWSNAKIEQERTRANEQRKKWKDQGGATNDELAKALIGNDKAKAKAAALEMAEKNGIKNIKQYQDAAKVLENDPVLKNMFNDKAKEKHIKFVIEADVAKNTEKAKEKLGSRFTPTMEANIKTAMYEKHLSKMSPDALVKQKGLLTSNDFFDEFLRPRTTTGAKEDKAFVIRASAKMTPAQRKVWKKEGFIR